MLAHRVVVLVLDDHRARLCRRRRRRRRPSRRAARAAARAPRPRTRCTRGPCRRRRRRARGPGGAGGAWRASRARCGPGPSVLGVYRRPSRAAQDSLPSRRRGEGRVSNPDRQGAPDREGGHRDRRRRRALRRHQGRQRRALEGAARGGARSDAPRGRRADGEDARDDEGRRDEDRPARLVHRHRVPAARVRRALPGGALEAALPGAADAVEEGEERARGGVGGSGRGAVRGLRARGRRRRVDRPGAPRRAARRPQGGGEDPVPGRGGGGPARHAERRDAPAAGEGAGARARRQGGRRRAEGARARGARLRVRGAEPALVRARVPRPPVHLRARRDHAALTPPRARDRVGGRHGLRAGQGAAAGGEGPLRRDRLPLLLRLDLPPAALQRRRPSRATTC